MFFRKKIDVKDYCAARLEALFSAERDKVWSQFRELCKDPALSGIDSTIYFEHIRAIMIDLLLIAIAKKFRWNVGSDANIFVWTYLKSRHAPQLNDIVSAYSQVFGVTPHDGIIGIIVSFSNQLAGGRLREDTKQRLHAEFYGVLESLFNDFQSMKLTTK
jgi:hypothetical protein